MKYKFKKIKLKQRLAIAVTLFFTVAAMNSYADVRPSSQLSLNPVQGEHVAWLREPIAFAVPTRRERMLVFPSPVLFEGSDAPKLTRNLISVLNDNGTLYMRAKKPFGRIRVPVEVEKTGETVLVDISGSPNADDTPVIVLLRHTHTATLPPAAGVTTADADTTAPTNSTPRPVPYAELVRYAVQRLYAPRRLIKYDPRIERTAMRTTRSVPLVAGNHVIAMPIASWRSRSLFVTAVLIKNNQNTPFTLHFASLRGRWLAASLYPFQKIGAAGTLHDRTTVFLISDEPFNTALYNNPEYAP